MEHNLDAGENVPRVKQSPRHLLLGLVPGVLVGAGIGYLLGSGNLSLAETGNRKIIVSVLMASLIILVTTGKSVVRAIKTNPGAYSQRSTLRAIIVGVIILALGIDLIMALE